MADDDVEMADASVRLDMEVDSDDKFPNRPRNHGRTLPFHDLYLTLFNPLNDSKKKSNGPAQARKKVGPHGPARQNPQEAKRETIQRFIQRWRNEVGNDIYPAFRLIIPEKDRERAMYGLKEKTIGKLLIQIVKINKDSEDGSTLLNWKLPGQRFSSMAGDFAGRCYEVLSKRAMRSSPGDMTIQEVNEQLDKLSVAQKEEQQRPILEYFYQRMNAEEMMWLIRIILRQMKIGATERTIFNQWHKHAETLFNVSSSLKRVCWELHDETIELEEQETDINLMQCFQPQLAQFQHHTLEKMVQKLRPTDTDKTFWVEEKLDGERMQLHMIEDDAVPGGKRFAFWSRKAKDYTYLYGSHLEDDSSALTRHLKGAFADNVRNIILDGEMITWDMETEKISAFGTLKTAALKLQKDPNAPGERPIYKVFDILYLNDTPLPRYTLRDRRKALEAAVISVHRRLEMHTYTEATSANEIEPKLRKVVEDASEGLVVKSPRSRYCLNERNDDWVKVKPEYMTEFGESLDCIVVGGYYGSGRRGGNLSSFLCGLRVDASHVAQGADERMVYSFFKVGGGMTATDYQEIRHHTEGKWHEWDLRKPPTQFIKLGGRDGQAERPDVWIRPDESIVIEAKAASIGGSEQFGTGLTLRFPRFKRLRMDKDWKSALSLKEFIELRQNVEEERNEKQFTIDESRKKRAKTMRKMELTVVGATSVETQQHLFDDATKQTTRDTADLFKGLVFYILTESKSSPKKSKAEVEAFVKAHGGDITQSRAKKGTIVIADSRTVTVASIQKEQSRSIIRPSWLFDCVTQAEIDGRLGLVPILLPYEPRHVFHVLPIDDQMISDGADAFQDAYARDISSLEEMRRLVESMPKVEEDDLNDQSFLDELERRGHFFDDNVPGWIFKGCTVFFADEGHLRKDGNAADAIADELAATTVVFAGGRLSRELTENLVTHVVVGKDHLESALDVRKDISSWKRLPRLVTPDWVEESWTARTRLDEERFSVT